MEEGREREGEGGRERMGGTSAPAHSWEET